MYLWKSISVPFYPINSLNSAEISDLELKNQLDKLRVRDWEWEIVEMVAIRSSDDKFFDFVIYLKCEVVGASQIRKFIFCSASILLAMYIKRARCSHYQIMFLQNRDAPEVVPLPITKLGFYSKLFGA